MFTASDGFSSRLSVNDSESPVSVRCFRLRVRLLVRCSDRCQLEAISLTFCDDGRVGLICAKVLTGVGVDGSGGLRSQEQLVNVGSSKSFRVNDRQTCVFNGLIVCREFEDGVGVEVVIVRKLNRSLNVQVI